VVSVQHREALTKVQGTINQGAGYHRLLLGESRSISKEFKKILYQAGYDPSIVDEEFGEFQANLGYITTPCLKRRKDRKRMEGRKTGRNKRRKEGRRKEGRKEGSLLASIYKSNSSCFWKY
jgi:hypothetical protein